MSIPDPSSVLNKQVGEPIRKGPACIGSLASLLTIQLLHMQGGKSDWRHVIVELTALLGLQSEHSLRRRGVVCAYAQRIRPSSILELASAIRRASGSISGK